MTGHVVFLSGLAAVPAGALLIDLASTKFVDVNSSSIELASVMKKGAPVWATQMVSWLGAVNAANARHGVSWWAYASSAKNLLSSPLGERFFHVMAVAEVARKTPVLYVRGATPGQMESLRYLLAGRGGQLSGFAFRTRHGAKFVRRATAVCKQFFIAAKTLLGHIGAKESMRHRRADLCLFTYHDMAPRPSFDAYFGRLPQQLLELKPKLEIDFAAYLYAPYRRRLRELNVGRSAPTAALFGALDIADYSRALISSLRQALKAPKGWSGREGAFGALAPLLEEAMVDDLRYGGYLHNVLVYRAAQKMFATRSARTLLYPFENKSLEKCLLLGARAGQPDLRTVGYQHTSITPRHLNFSLSGDEMANTPLPDRIITVGAVTQRWLQARGYPAHMLVPGCSLRQALGGLLDRRSFDGHLRILMALSSSARELREAVQLARAISQKDPRIEFGVRPHPEFPLRLLEPATQAWVAAQTRACVGTSLEDDLRWCDVVAYASSSVALEALARGRPVVHLSLSDYLDTDPVLDPVALHWRAGGVDDFARALREIQNLSEGDYTIAARTASRYMQEYLVPPSAGTLAPFLELT